MPSRAEIRGGIEAALRTASLIVLAWMFWLSLERGRPERFAYARTASLGAALKDWSASGIAPDRISIQLDSIPVPADRDWIRALSHSGSTVGWRGNFSAVAVSVEPIASPRGGITVLGAAPDANRITIEDDLGLIEGATAENGGARFDVRNATGSIVAKTASTKAVANVPDSIRIGRILVLGSAGWETKFVTSALEEAGWKVDAEMRVAPAVEVSQGASAAIDTARYSAVIALDAAAASRAAEINRYVVSGGGVIIAGSASSLEAFAGLRAGATGKPVVPSVLEREPGSATLASISIVPIVALRGDAIRLESRNGATSVAARRHGAGRVLQIGYVDTWRWRMSGGDSAPADHREWWTHAIASVAYAPTVGTGTSVADNAPLARLIDALGPQSTVSSSLASAAGSISLWLLFAILSVSLLAEWASRRLRGSR